MPVYRYRRVPEYLRTLRDNAQLAQRELGERLGKPHSWIYIREIGNRRVDAAEFADGAKACDVDPTAAAAVLLKLAGSRRR